MTITSAEPHLAAIPETMPMNGLPGSARASPRSTSDSPARGTAPISPTSRLLRPTLSSQAKASWIPELPTASGTPPTGADSDGGSRQGQEPVAAIDTQNQVTTAANLLSPSPPSAGWQSTQETKQSPQGAAGQSSSNILNMEVTNISVCIVACASCKFSTFGSRAATVWCISHSVYKMCCR